MNLQVHNLITACHIRSLHHRKPATPMLIHRIRTKEFEGSPTSPGRKGFSSVTFAMEQRSKSRQKKLKPQIHRSLDIPAFVYDELDPKYSFFKPKPRKKQRQSVFGGEVSFENYKTFMIDQTVQRSPVPTPKPKPKARHLFYTDFKNTHKGIRTTPVQKYLETCTTPTKLNGFSEDGSQKRRPNRYFHLLNQRKDSVFEEVKTPEVRLIDKRLLDRKPIEISFGEKLEVVNSYFKSLNNS